MDIYLLTGASGTGKSYHAMDLTEKLNIEGIIDDGLFIYKNAIVAGTSAKRAETKVGSIKVALFYDEAQRTAVIKAIEEKNPNAILVIGTSDKMAMQIAETLGLKAPKEGSDHIIHIEDITTDMQRETALEERQNYGRHVIPAPALQLRQNFAGYFIEQLKFFIAKGTGADLQRTVVRPSFSYKGDYFITEKAMNDIIIGIARKSEGIDKVILISHKSDRPDKYELEIDIGIKVGYDILETSEVFQSQVKSIIESMTAFNVSRIDIEVRTYA